MRNKMSLFLLLWLTGTCLPAAEDMKILIFGSAQSTCDGPSIAAELKQILARHADYDDGTSTHTNVMVTWRAIQPGNSALMEGYHNPKCKTNNLAVLDGNYDYVVLIDKYFNVLCYHEFHFEGVYQFSKKILATGATPLLLTPCPAKEGHKGILTEISYRVANGCGIGAVPAGEAIHAEGASTDAERSWLAAACIFSRITFLNAKDSAYNPDSVDKVALGNRALSTVSAQLGTDQYSGAYNRRGLMKLRDLTPGDLHDARVGALFCGTSTEDGINGKLNALIRRYTVPTNNYISYKVSKDRILNQGVLNKAKARLENPDNYDNFYIMYSRSAIVGADDILSYTGGGTNRVQPNLSAYLYDKQRINFKRGGKLPIDDLASNVTAVYNTANFAARFGGWQIVAVHVAGARMFELAPKLHPYRDRQHLSGPYLTIVATLMHTCSLGFPVKYTGADSNVGLALEVGYETARQLSFLTETGVGVPDSDLRISTKSLPAMETGIAYGVSLEAAGGTAPYRWKLADGSLPDGISLASGGALSGTATNSADTGSRVLVFRVEDGNGAIWKAPFRVRVHAK